MLGRIFRIGVAGILAANLAGCIIIPTDYYAPGARQNLDDTPPENLVPTVTTREEILLKLGEPTRFSTDETEIWYETEKIKAWLIIGDRGGEIRRRYFLILNFDTKGVLSSQRFFALTM